jgi:hypothetical protein
MRREPLLVLLLLAGMSGCAREPGAARETAVAVAPEEAARLLIDRNWLDIWPRSETQRLHVFRFTPAMGGGVYQDRTLYKGTFELFRFGATPTTIVFDMPETREIIHTGYRIERVSGPEPFDLRLTLDVSPRGPRVFHGRSVESGASGESDFLPPLR